MAKNKTQPKIEAFLQELTAICQKYGMDIDANGGGRRGEGKNRGEVCFNEGCPLILYTLSGNKGNYRKVGYLWTSFLGVEENLTYNFEPKIGTPYKEIVIPEPIEDFDEIEEETKKPVAKKFEIKPIIDEVAKINKEKPIQLPPSALADAIAKAKKWQMDKDV